MVVPAETVRVSATGNGTTATYPYTNIKIFDEDDLYIIVIDTTDDALPETVLTISDDYTVDPAGIGVVAGGNITLVDDGQDWIDGSGFLATGWKIVIRRIIDLTQETSVTSQGGHLPEYLEKQFDRGTMADLQLQEQLDRSLKLPEGETGSASVTTLPGLAERINTIAAYDSNGAPTTATLSSVGADVTASFVTISAESSLTNERRLAATANQTTITDNGAGNTVQVGIATDPVLPGNASTTGTMTVGTGETITTGDLTLSAGKASITDSHATTTPQVDAIQSSTGDAALRVSLNGGKSYIFGIDNDDGDLFALAAAPSSPAVLGTGNVLVLNFNGGAFLGTGWTAGLSNKPFTGALNMRLATSGTGGPRICQREIVNSGDSDNIYGSYVIEGCVLTTDATQTSLAEINGTGVISHACVVEATVVGFRTGGSSGSTADSAGYKLLAIYKNNAGTLTQVGSTTQTVLGESQAAWDATLDASSNQMRVRVTGAANNNIRWSATITVSSTTIRVDS